jgi:hypothetical protein
VELEPARVTATPCDLGLTEGAAALHDRERSCEQEFHVVRDSPASQVVRIDRSHVRFAGSGWPGDLPWPGHSWAGAKGPSLIERETQTARARSGRGPNSDISPRSTFATCAISSNPLFS